MLYAIRNAQGEIQSVSHDADRGGSPIEPHDPALHTFLDTADKEADFNAADADFVRVLEDLIDTLIQKNIIRHTDLPAAAQKKLVMRKGMRRRMQDALNLLDNNDRLL